MKSLIKEPKMASMKSLREELLIFAKGLLAAFVFCGLFILILIAKRKVSPSPIIYYEGIYIILSLVAVFMICAIAIGLITPRLLFLVSHNIMLGIVLGAVLSYSFHVTFPTLIDRSISMFMLSLLRSETLSESEIQCNFVNQFVINDQALTKRIAEQIKTGNIREYNSKWQTTDRGTMTTSLWIHIAELFSIRSNIINVKPIEKCGSENQGKLN